MQESIVFHALTTVSLLLPTPAYSTYSMQYMCSLMVCVLGEASEQQSAVTSGTKFWGGQKLNGLFLQWR